MKKSPSSEKLKHVRKELEKQEENILDHQDRLMESFLAFMVDYYKSVGEKEILEKQSIFFESLPGGRKKDLKKKFQALHNDKECLRRELVRFEDLWWVKDEFRTKSEDYTLQMPRACSFESTTPCVPSAYKFQRALQVMLSKVYALLYHFGFRVPEYAVHWKDHTHRKQERVFDIEVNLDNTAGKYMMAMKNEIERYDAILKELDELYEVKEKELDEQILEGRKKKWDSL